MATEPPPRILQVPTQPPRTPKSWPNLGHLRFLIYRPPSPMMVLKGPWKAPRWAQARLETKSARERPKSAPRRPQEAFLGTPEGR
eukprot:7364273-Pyramimonas_sp.AAC.1